MRMSLKLGGTTEWAHELFRGEHCPALWSALRREVCFGLARVDFALSMCVRLGQFHQSQSCRSASCVAVHRWRRQSARTDATPVASATTAPTMVSVVRQVRREAMKEEEAKRNEETKAWSDIGERGMQSHTRVAVGSHFFVSTNLVKGNEEGIDTRRAVRLSDCAW